MKLLTTSLVLSSVALFAFAAAADQGTDSFVQNAYIGNKFEVEASKIALEKSQDQDIRDFAKAMITDHTQSKNDLDTAAKSARVNEDFINPELDAKHQQLLDKLKKANGADFDREYLNAQTNAHNEAVGLFENYSRSGSEPKLKSYAAKTLPTLQEHKSHLTGVKADTEYGNNTNGANVPKRAANSTRVNAKTPANNNGSLGY